MAQQERAIRTREKILDAAAQEFAVQGYSRTTINGVAARMGMSKGALYGHFPSKRALAGVLVQQSRMEWCEILANSDRPGMAAGSVLERLVLELTRHLRADVRLRAALRLAVDGPGIVAPLSVDFFEDMSQTLGAVVRRAQHEGAVPPCPPELVVKLLITTVFGELYASLNEIGAEVLSAEGHGDIWRVLFTVLIRQGG